MPLTIRPAVPADLPALAALEQACFSHPWSEKSLAETLQNGRSVFLAAEREGEVLGYLGMEFVLDEGSITNVAVFPGCRRQGVADALVTGLLHRAAAIGLATVTLEVRQSNAPAIALYEKLGFRVVPGSGEIRRDIIQAVELGSREAMVAFCKGIQSAAPVDSYVTPEPWAMPGYESEVIMAAGAFVQGASIELSADGPIRPPYAVYFQGGLTWFHAKLGILMSIQKLLDAGIIEM